MLPRISLCRRRAFAPVQKIKVSSFKTLQRLGGLNCRPPTSATQKFVRWIHTIQRQSHGQQSFDLSFNPGSGDIPLNSGDLYQNYASFDSNAEKNSIAKNTAGEALKPWRHRLVLSLKRGDDEILRNRLFSEAWYLNYPGPLQNYAPLESNAEKTPIAENTAVEAHTPWRMCLVRSEKRKNDKRFWNRLIRDKGLWSHNWRTSLEALEERYSQLVEAREIKANEIAESGQKALPIKSQPEQKASSVKRRPIYQQHAERIRPPSVWTALSFMDYVEDLTKSSVNRLAKYRLYGKDGSHVVAVSNILERLFASVATKNFLSARVCNVAMQYFFRHYQISKAKAIFFQMERLHQEIQTPTVNMMLFAAAKRKDLYNFNFLLNLMIKWGFEPDANTWRAFLAAVESYEVQAVIIKSMRDRDFLKSKPMIKSTVGIVIRGEANKCLSSGSSPESLLSSLDRQYGANWLSVGTANNLLDEVGRKNGVQEAWSLFKTLRRRGLRPDRITLGTLLQICRFYNNHSMIIKLLQRFRSKFGVNPDQGTYNILFAMAWNYRMYNFLRVIWRCACLQGLASEYMCQLISRSIRSEEENPVEGTRKNNNKIWKNSAGAVALGIELHNRNHFINYGPETNAQQNGDTDGLGVKTRLERLLDEDLALLGHCWPEKSLEELLSSAQALDAEWHRSGAWKAESTEWKCKNAITLTLTQRKP